VDRNKLLLSEAIYSTLSDTKVNYNEVTSAERPKSASGSKFQSKEAKYTYGSTDPMQLIKKHKEERREFFNSGIVKTNFKINPGPTDLINKYKMTSIKPSNQYNSHNLD
jgi:hypothetical protein